MSRSRLRNAYMRSLFPRQFHFSVNSHGNTKNSHYQDEMPKNRPSRLIMENCSADPDWLQDSTSFGGHSRQKGGHRRVSGLVRASLKRKFQRMLEEENDQEKK